MKQHKWHKEIKAWADGAEIECLQGNSGWWVTNYPRWDEDTEYRIKPQPKEPQYLVALRLTDGTIKIGISGELIELKKGESPDRLIGKIKLEVDDG
jgi:hypothetical protein